MDSQFLQIQTLLEQRAEITARLNLIPYDGSIEIKDRNGQKYIYIRKRVLGRNTSTYVDSYSDELFASISKLLKDAKEYKKQIRKINNELAKLGYSGQELSSRVLLNIDFARANMKSNIYDQAILEGITTTIKAINDSVCPQIAIPDGIKVISNLRTIDEKINNPYVLHLPSSIEDIEFQAGERTDVMAFYCDSKLREGSKNKILEIFPKTYIFEPREWDDGYAYFPINFKKQNVN